MDAPDRFVRPDRVTTWLVPAALLLPICLVFALIYYHRQARAAQDDAVARATRVYSGVVAWQFARQASNVMHRAGDAAIAQIARAANGAVRIRPGDVPAVVFTADATRPDSPVIARAVSVFRYDDDTKEVVGGGPRFRRDRSGEIALELRRLFPDSLHDPHQIRFDRRDGTVTATVYGLVRTDADRVRAVYGIETDPAVFLAMFDSLVTNGSLLPSALLRTGLRRDQVRITLTTTTGDALFTIGSARGNAISATDTLEAARSGLRATVELDPVFAASLVVGDAASPPLRFIALLLIVSCALAVAALMQLRRSRALASARAQFIANVSHELRTPLTHISMFAETLMMQPGRSPDERFRFASIIHREARRLTNLVESVLRFSRLDARRDRIESTAMDLSAEIREAAEAFRPVLDGAQASLVCDLPDTTPIHGDPSAIRQIIVNLLDNAIKYGPLGQTITVRLRASRDHVVLEVADQSPGIPLADRERVFEPFARVSRPGQRSVPGAGIGLGVVRGLVTLHGGRVTIADAVGGGTLVRIELPAPGREREREREYDETREPTTMITRTDEPVMRHEHV